MKRPSHLTCYKHSFIPVQSGEDTKCRRRRFPGRRGQISSLSYIYSAIRPSENELPPSHSSSYETELEVRASSFRHGRRNQCRGNLWKSDGSQPGRGEREGKKNVARKEGNRSSQRSILSLLHRRSGWRRTRASIG